MAGQAIWTVRVTTAVRRGPPRHCRAAPTSARRCARCASTRAAASNDLADATGGKLTYLSALEEMRLELLPSRPFTIGYIRAYAQALGLDPETAVDASGPTSRCWTSRCAPRSASRTSAIRGSTP